MPSLTPLPESNYCPLPTRRGLNRVQAAEYIGIGASKFDALVDDRRMPEPKKIDGRRVWDKHALDRAFDKLNSISGDERNPWDCPS